MSTPLEHYALLSDLGTGPLVSRDGSIDWLCLPRFDSPAVFCAILGDADAGRWRIAAVDGEVEARRYRPDTFVLETIWVAPGGRVAVTDFLPPGVAHADLVRRVYCLEGRVEVEHDLRIRFDFARATPWIRRIIHPRADVPVWLSLAGPDGIMVAGPPLSEAAGEDRGRSREHGAAEGSIAPTLDGRFALSAGERRDWSLTWFPSYEPLPDLVDADRAEAEAVRFWTDWASGIAANANHGRHQPAVRRSLLVLRALTHGRTGGIVAAPTTSLPERFGGGRNWDYRYTWLRDAALTLEVMVEHGLTRTAVLWRDWLLRAVAGDARTVKIMYGLAGERDLHEFALDHLPGYEDSRPVRIGNGAAGQYQADVVGEVMIALAALRDAGVPDDEYSWALQKNLLRYCAANLNRPDHGIWEMRGPPRFFTHGRAMAWAAFDQGIQAVQTYGFDGPVERWRLLRDRLRTEIETHGFCAELNSFTQTYDNREVDASLLQLPHTGLVGYDDPRMLGTVDRIERDLQDPPGLLRRYRTELGLDGLAGDEYPFLICTCWLVEQYARSGRRAEAERLLDQVVGYAGELGLLAEQYDPVTQRLAGNYPQAFSHLGLIRAADALAAGSVVAPVPTGEET
jgi:GH15 family glucan-1,4-alpha-glucosidase